MNRFFLRFRQFGGLELLREYARKSILWIAVGQFLAVLFHKKSLVEADNTIRKLITPQLREEFFPVMKQLEKKYEDVELLQKRTNKVWFCWMQGLDCAPQVVNVCYHSLKKNLKGKEIIVITSENIHDYVTFPDFIEEKFKKGIIPMAHYTDMLRLELLIRYGGTWIDATVYCSDNQYPEELLDCDLFVFQQLRKNSSEFGGLSNWFITSCTENLIFLILRDMLYQYWSKYNCIIDYYLFHFFFCMIAEYHQQAISQMPSYSNRWPLMLATWLGDDYQEEKYKKLREKTFFHKLTYRFKNNVERSGTFYDVLIQKCEV